MIPRDSQLPLFIEEIGQRFSAQQSLFSWMWRLFLFAYLGVGIGSLALIFFLETIFFNELTHRPIVAFLLAGIWEFTKLGSSLIRYILGIAKKITSIYIPFSIRGVTWGVLACMILVSIFCCAVTLSSWCYLADAANADERYLPLVESALLMIQEGFHLNLSAETLISIVALMISLVLQLTSFMILVHIFAIYTGEIEHRVEMKMKILQTQQAYDEEALLLRRNKLRMKAATKASLQQIDELAKTLLDDLAARKE